MSENKSISKSDYEMMVVACLESEDINIIYDASKRMSLHKVPGEQIVVSTKFQVKKTRNT